MSDQLYQQKILGLARRANQLKSGFTNIKYSLEKGKGELLLIAHDAGIDSKKLLNLASQKKVHSLIWGDKEYFSNLMQSNSNGVLIMGKSFVKPFLKEGS